MREIKFRAWDDELKEMVLESELDDCESLLNCGELVIGRFDTNEDWYELIRLQFTGLKDKSGKEVYEGDIINCPRRIINKLAIVEFDNIKKAFTFRELHNKEYTRYFQEFVEYNEIEIIGNIYENPELLEVKK